MALMSMVREASPEPATLGSATREQMILRYAPLVRQVVGRLLVVLPQTLDREDLLSYGTIGLIEAVDRFDPSHGTTFETFAAERIRGSVIDALRAADWIPRSARKRAKEIQHAFIDLEARLGRAPTEQEVAEALGLTMAQLHRAMADAVSSMISLQRPVRSTAGDEATVTLLDCLADETAGPGQDAEQRELRLCVVEALRRLGERERLVLSLYYEQSLTLREIGQVMDICESRVWQLHARAIMRIRAYVEQDAEGAQQAAPARRLKKGA